jgi:uncharacterized protein involved in exopolysaccharide biosynthesis
MNPRPHSSSPLNGRSPLIRDAEVVEGGSFKPADIAYILFRHKWKIILCSLTGIAAATIVWSINKPTYVSTATLLIRYVLETRAAPSPDTGDQIRNPDSRGDSIITSEIEMLMSLDLAEEVARDVGPTNIIQPEELGTNPELQAAGIIRKNLTVGVRPKSSVIGISYSHPDPKVARDVVTALINRYLKMHARIHRALDQLDDLARQADQKRSLVEQTEASLRAIKGELGIVSVQESQKAIGDLVTRLGNDIVQAEAELAEGKAALARITNSLPALALPAAPVTNQAPAAPIPPDVVKAHEAVTQRLDALRKREQELLLQFTPTSTYVTRVSSQIADAVAERDRLVTDHPGLVTIAAPTVSTVERATLSGKRIDPTAELARIDSLEAKIKVLRSQLEEKRAEAIRIANKESQIAELERKLEISEKQYSYLSTALEEARVNDAVSNNRLANISVVQSASPAAPDTGFLMKVIAGCLAGGVGLGLALALGIEFYTDQSVRRPKQVTDGLHLPLFLSLPRLVPAPRPLVANDPTKLIGAGEGGASTPPPTESDTQMAQYAEALRDRLIMHFQAKELHHKPKLIGVTSCGRGAGVTTIASNLASSLSETGEGNVLYVDVSQMSGPAVHPFHKGKTVVGIDNALTAETRDNALVSENLYAVSLAEANSRKVGILPKRMANLVQQIKASDYDYIIFDLPPVSQTSATARVTGLLDMTVMVLESEKTHADLAKQAVGLLAESRTDMVAVLNKHRRYLPQKMDSDL